MHCTCYLAQDSPFKCVDEEVDPAKGLSQSLTVRIWWGAEVYRASSLYQRLHCCILLCRFTDAARREEEHKEFLQHGFQNQRTESWKPSCDNALNQLGGGQAESEVSGFLIFFYLCETLGVSSPFSVIVIIVSFRGIEYLRILENSAFYIRPGLSTNIETLMSYY